MLNQLSCCDGRDWWFISLICLWRLRVLWGALDLLEAAGQVVNNINVKLILKIKNGKMK